MNTQNHLRPEDIQSLLFNELADDQLDQVTREMSEHIADCELCQRALDEMAASPELWEKASEFITDAHLSETIAVNLNASKSTDPPKRKESGESSTEQEKPWDYPVNHLFEPPSHPEMLGRIGNYDIEREVGRGGMGVVFKAFDHELNRPLAVKVLAPHLAASGAARKRFAREGRAAAAVLHPNVIAIHGVDSTNKTPYIVMPLVTGPSLQKLVDQNGPLELKEMVRITMQIAAGLTAAHSQGVIHRDIKPANVLIEESVSRVVITDFGLARAENDASMTHTGWLAGTPNFMSPEQANGKRLDGRSDLFSLGSVMYFMATGRMPFRADAPMAVLNRICTDQPTPIRQVNSDVSRTFSEIVEKLLRKEPDERFQSAGELHETLKQYLAYLHQPDISKPPIIFDRPRPHWFAWIGTSIACLIAFGLMFTAMNQGWFTGSKSNNQFETVEGKTNLVDRKTNHETMTASATSVDGNDKLAVVDAPSDQTEPKRSYAEFEGDALGRSLAETSDWNAKMDRVLERYSIKSQFEFESDMHRFEAELRELQWTLEAMGPLTEKQEIPNENEELK